MTATEPKRPIGLISIDVKTVYDRLSRAKVEETVTYQELEVLIGRSVREKNRWILESARRKALVDGLLFATVSKIGVKRLNDEQIVAVGHDSLSRVHRASHLGIKKLTAVRDYGNLPEQAKKDYGVYSSALGMIAHVTKDKSLKKLESKLETSQQSLPLAKTLEAFRS